MPGGNVGPEVVLDLKALDGISSVIPPGRESGEAHGLLSAGAGAVAADLRSRANGAGSDLPALPSSARWCTVGGILACNAAGARSFRYGAARAWVRAVEWVRADGRVERLQRTRAVPPEWRSLSRRLLHGLPDPLPWPSVRKNSSGYALDAFLDSGDPVDLVVGSEGTLGVVTAATLEVSPPPECRAVLLLGVRDYAGLVEMALEAGTVPQVVACEYFGRRLVELGGLHLDPRLHDLSLDRGMLLVEVAGTREAVAAARRIVSAWGDTGVLSADDPEGMEALWEFRHAASPTISQALEGGRRSIQFIEDSVVPVDRLGAYLAGLEDLLARHETDAVIFGHAGDGNLHVNPLVDLNHSRWRERVEGILSETVELVASLGGTLAGEHGDGRLRTSFLHRTFSPEVMAAFRRVKETFDPHGILNPGVKVSAASVEPLGGLGVAPGFASGSQGPERLDRRG
jgi:FAD/FMN-containing dehydrogenase